MIGSEPGSLSLQVWCQALFKSFGDIRIKFLKEGLSFCIQFSNQVVIMLSVLSP